MEIKNLFNDDNAVSPVIGVILMVAITVILAAVIGAFVLNLGGSQSATPSTSFEFNYENPGPSSANVTSITHNGGNELDVTNIEVTIGGTTAYDSGSINGDFADESSDSAWTGGSGSATAGNELRIAEDAASNSNPTEEINAGEEVNVIFKDPNSDETTIIGESEVDY